MIEWLIRAFVYERECGDEKEKEDDRNGHPTILVDPMTAILLTYVRTARERYVAESISLTRHGPARVTPRGVAG